MRWVHVRCGALDACTLDGPMGQSPDARQPTGVRNVDQPTPKGDAEGYQRVTTHVVSNGQLTAHSGSQVLSTRVLSAAIAKPACGERVVGACTKYTQTETRIRAVWRGVSREG